jgi:hypothetical protein
LRIPLLSRRPAPAKALPVDKDSRQASKRDQYLDIDDWAWEIIEAVAPLTMTSPERIYALLGAVDYLVANRVPGAVLECGVWRGGSMVAAAKRLIQLGATDRHLYLFDTFEGMPPPTQYDTDVHGNEAATLLAESNRTQALAGEPSVWAYASLDTVEAAIQSTGYPSELCHYVVGKVEDTLPAQAPDQVGILRLDTDWYESTLHELTHLYDRLADGGVLLIDDYGHWQGARRATDEFFRNRGVHPLIQRVDYTGRLILKL